MANVKQAVDAVLKQEDATLRGVVTNYRSDLGGLTRFGLCARWHPELVACGFFDAVKVGPDEALHLAESAYESCYEKPLCLASVEDQGVATALLSFATNEGTHEAVTLLQRALTSLGRVVTEDGQMGPGTLQAVNAVDGKALVARWCQFEEAFYQNVVRANPAQKVNLLGWENRVANVEKLCAA